MGENVWRDFVAVENGGVVNPEVAIRKGKDGHNRRNTARASGGVSRDSPGAAPLALSLGTWHFQRKQTRSPPFSHDPVSERSAQILLHP